MPVRIAPVVVLLAIAACSTGPAPPASPGRGSAPVTVWPAPIDPQVIRDQDDMTWDDYTPIPGVDWARRDSRGSVKTLQLAIATADFPDQPFVMTLPKKSDMYGNPQVDPVKREDINKFVYDFYMTPSAMNHGHTIAEYWLEQSHGRVGVQTTMFGPYRMPGKVYQYGFSSNNDLPAGDSVRNLARDLRALINADPRAKDAYDTSKYKPFLQLFAGYDETATWQEFGEMKFRDTSDIPKEWGNPDPKKPRWVRSRYGQWTTWHAAQWPWSNAGGGIITQGESVNSIRHELGHAAFLIGDNYNNPFAQPYRRAPAGPWELMDRGTFNGPEGPHSRWKVPATTGGMMSAGVMLRQRMQFRFVDSSQVLLLHRNALAKSGLAVARVTARIVDPLPGELNGVHVRLDSVRRSSPDTVMFDLTPRDDPATNPVSAGVPNYTFYTLEVVQRIGYDSYTPDNGVLIAKNKDRASAVGGPNGFNTYVWTIDAHPEDINVVDFTRPGGERVMRTMADYRQLNDALFHAGTNSGSSYEHVDVPNRLHFYVVDLHRSDKGVLSYTLAARSLDGAGPHTRGVRVTAPPRGGQGSRVDFVVTNIGSAAPFAASHPTRDPALFANDVYRLKVTVSGEGWSAGIQNALAAIRFGDSLRVPVFVKRTSGASGTATITLTATSESDATKADQMVHQITK
jgi:M6 family metalloprotease-like protein